MIDLSLLYKHLLLDAYRDHKKLHPTKKALDDSNLYDQWKLSCTEL